MNNTINLPLSNQIALHFDRLTECENCESGRQALAYLNTFYKYYTILSAHSIDGRKPMLWGQLIIDSFSSVYGEECGKLFFEIFRTYADNPDLHNEFTSYTGDYTIGSLIGEFESYYANIDFKSIRAASGRGDITLIEEYISKFGEEKGHNFLSVFYTTMNFLITHPDGPESDDYRASWMQIVDYYISEMFGKDALQEYISVFESDDYNSDIHLKLFDELHAFHDEYFSLLLIDAWSKISELIM